MDVWGRYVGGTSCSAFGWQAGVPVSSCWREGAPKKLEVFSSTCALLPKDNWGGGRLGGGVSGRAALHR